MEQANILSELEEEIILEPATPGQRFVNLLLDSIGTYIVMAVVGVIIGVLTVVSAGAANSTTAMAGLQMILIFVNLGMYVAYFTLIEGLSNGRSLGKLATRTRVVKEDGSPITLKDAFIRSLCRCIPFEPFSMLAGRPWHDTISRTKVVKI